MAPRAGTRRTQLTVGGLGKHFKSPKRPRDKRHTQHVVEIPGQASKRRRLMQRMEQLLQKSPIDNPELVNGDDVLDLDNDVFTADLDPGDDDYAPSDAEPETAQDAHELPVQETQDADNCDSTVDPEASKSHRRIHPDAPADRLYANSSAN